MLTIHIDINTARLLSSLAWKECDQRQKDLIALKESGGNPTAAAAILAPSTEALEGLQTVLNKKIEESLH